ncbi:MAG: hypothetical protein HOQ29_17290 [Acidobacteria bacterium]|nr:hypothetical protein [Acidobacteriota bacterium]
MLHPARLLVLIALGLLVWGAEGSAQAPASAPTDLDAFMARALQRRDEDRKTLGDYVLDEVETLEILGPGGAPINRFKREYTWYVRDGMHVRSPLKYDGVPIPEADRRAYEERWIRSETSRRKHRTEREAARAKEGKSPDFTLRPINEPRFVSESYFLDFKFEPGNYYLAGRETLDAKEVLRIDYLPTHLFDDDHDDEYRVDEKGDRSTQHEGRDAKQQDRERQAEHEIDRKMNKTAQVTLWVDPANHQIVKYTFTNVWMDFLPAAWLVRVDDLRASMEMGQPFEGVWLPKNVNIRGSFTLANGSFEAGYRRDFSRYRKADVSSRVTVPKQESR